MKKISTILLLVTSIAAYSGGREVTFSSYDPSLKHESTNEYGAHVFRGTITVTGNLFFEFDMAGPKRAADVLSARFVPDSASVARLPNVVAGHYAGSIKYISLEPASAALEAIYGKEKAEHLKHGDGSEIGIAASIELNNFLTGVECDSRRYWSTSFRAKLTEDGAVPVKAKPPHGC